MKELGKINLKKESATLQSIFVKVLLNARTSTIDTLPRETVEVLADCSEWCTDDREASRIVRSLVLGGDSEFGGQALRAFANPFLDKENSNHYPNDNGVAIGVITGLFQSVNCIERDKEFFTRSKDFLFLGEFANVITAVLLTQLHPPPPTEGVSESAQNLANSHHKPAAFKELYSAAETYAKGFPENNEERILERFVDVQKIRKKLKAHAKEVDQKVKSMVTIAGEFERRRWSQAGAVVISALTFGSFSRLDAELISGLTPPRKVTLSTKYNSPTMGLFI